MREEQADYKNERLLILLSYAANKCFIFLDRGGGLVELLIKIARDLKTLSISDPE